MSQLNWYALFSKPRKELQVAGYLHAKGFEVFHPTLRVKPVNPRSSTIRSFFPRYLFVRADLEVDGRNILQHVPGCVGLVEFDGYAPPIADHVITDLRRRLAEIEAAGGLHLDGLQSGDPIRIAQGPFAGYHAIFDTRLCGEERVQVLLQWLGRAIKVKVDARAVEKRPRMKAG